jgi:hypothetical protein
MNCQGWRQWSIIVLEPGEQKTAKQDSRMRFLELPSHTTKKCSPSSIALTAYQQWRLEVTTVRKKNDTRTESSGFTNANTRNYKTYCRVFQWLRRGIGLVNRLIGSSLVVTTISSYTLKITVTIAHITSPTESSNSSSGHTAVPFGTQVKSIPIPVFSHILSARTTHREQFYCCVAQTTQKTSHVISPPVHWLTVA